MLEVRDLIHRYNGRAVLTIDHFVLQRGELLALAGPNGSGKSTLLRIMACLEHPSSGDILLDREPLDGKARRHARRNITLVEQHPFLFSGSVESNLRYGLEIRGIPASRSLDRAGQALERLGASELLTRSRDELSQGEIQKVSLARALALKPTFLLLDEPVSAADRATSAAVYTVIAQERDAGAGILFTSHQLEEAYRWSDEAMSLADGSIIDVLPENLFRTHLTTGSSNYRVAQLGPVELHLMADHSGPATVLIPPEDIIVSRHRLDASARNQFEGTVARVSRNPSGTLSVTVDVGIELVARVTQDAMTDLQLNVGSKAVIAVKATAVRVY